LNILDKTSELLSYNKFIERVLYLKNLPPKNGVGIEDFIYEIYKSTLKIAGTRTQAFSDFSKDNFEQFLRLKFKWINNNY
jgi:hypothetical protein